MNRRTLATPMAKVVGLIRLIMMNGRLNLSSNANVKLQSVFPSNEAVKVDNCKVCRFTVKANKQTGVFG
jgi:hypothetical protein